MFRASPSVTVMAIRLAIKDAFFRAIRGAICALWVPPAVIFLLGAITTFRGFQHKTWPLWEFLIRNLLACIGMSSLGFLVGAIGLVLVGVPVLFFLTLFRVSHPLIVCAVGAFLTYWRLAATPLPFQEDTILYLGVTDLTGLVAVFYARSYVTYGVS